MRCQRSGPRVFTSRGDEIVLAARDVCLAKTKSPFEINNIKKGCNNVACRVPLRNNNSPSTGGPTRLAIVRSSSSSLTWFRSRERSPLSCKSSQVPFGSSCNQTLSHVGSVLRPNSRLQSGVRGLFDVAMKDLDQTLSSLCLTRAGFGILAEHVEFNLAFNDLHQ